MAGHPAALLCSLFLSYACLCLPLSHSAPSPRHSPPSWTYCQVAAQLLLEEVQRGGVVDGSHQGLLLTLAAMGPDELATLR